VAAGRLARPANVRTLITTRQGGHSLQPFNSFNLGSHVGDDADAVAANRELLRSRLPDEPAWLNQVHGTHVVNAAEVGDTLLDADASYSTTPGKVCVVMTATACRYCCATTRAVVAAACRLARPVRWRAGSQRDGHRRGASSLMAWLGPAIGPDAFEVGAEVRAAFMAQDPAAEHAFTAIGEENTWPTSTCWHASGWPRWVSTGCMAATSAPSSTANASSPIAATRLPAAWPA
jgi:copper oxidase (laccase) domain-containing protein